MKRSIPQLRLLLLALTAWSATAAADTPSPSERNLKAALPVSIYDFAERQLPDNLQVVNGKLQLSPRHYLLRQQSLQWDFRSGGTLTFHQAVPYFTAQDASRHYQRSAICSFSGWIYNEKPLPGAVLRVEIGNSKRKTPDTSFEYQLNFQGWRAIRVAYGRDMTGKPAFDMDYIRMVAPRNVPQGTLYLDALMPTILLDNRHIDPDEQQPFIRKAFGGQEFDSPLQANHLPRLPEKPLTESDRQGFRLLEQKLCDEIRRDVRVLPLARLRESVVKMGIRRAADGTVTGPHLSYGSQTDTFLLGGRLPEYQAEIVELRGYGTLMLQVAAAYRAATQPEERQELAALFQLLAEHLFDQGLVDGSIRGTSHHFGYVSREFFAAFLLMRDELQKARLLDTAAGSAIWYNGLRFLRDQSKMPPPNADILNTLTMSSLVALALLPDTPEKAAMLRAFQTYYGGNIAMKSPGQTGGFKADGCIYHHWGHYPGYGFPALKGAALACDMLTRTPWSLPQEAHDNLKLALKSAFLYTNPRRGGSAENPEVPTALCGRHPFEEPDLQSCAIAYRRMAADPEMAAIYKRLAPRDPDFAAVKPAELPQGHWSFNYGGFGIHRTGEKMVTLKGYNRTVWSSEIYTRDNRYGRYQSNGTIEIMPQGEHRQEGWDWNRIPGATTLHRPLDVLNSPDRHTLMLISPSRMSGSSHLGNRYGMFGVELTEPEKPHFDAKFHAVKSVFAFGPRLITLGSDIRSGSDYRAETTLFQFPVQAGKYPVFFNSDQPLDALPLTRETQNPAWTADAFGNVWYVFSPGTLRLTRQLQHSRNNKTSKATQGEFAVAYLDHGIRPNNARYEYLLELDADPATAAQKMARWRDPAQRPYRILRQDASCHAVRDRESGVTAAIFFRPGKLPDAAPLLEALTPAYVMYRREAGELEIGLNTPDLADFIGKTTDVNFTGNRERESRIVTVVLQGKWQAVQTSPEVKVLVHGDETRISATFRHGIARQLSLQQRN